MKLYHDPNHPGRHLAPPLDHPEEADWGDESDDDYDSLLYSTDEFDDEFDDEYGYEAGLDSDPELKAERQKMHAEIDAELDAKRTPSEVELNLKIKRMTEVRRAGRNAIREGRPLPSACIACFKIGSTADGTLMQCSRCKSIKYCSAACQEAHWPKHKTQCKKFAVDTTNPDKYPFHAIFQTKFLHNRDETKTYQLLIDCLRMHQEDVYALKGDLMFGTIYNQEASSIKAFKQFLAKAKWVPGFFPAWWTEEKEKTCIEYGMTDAHLSLKCAQEKHDIQRQWKDPQMPMKLRMVAESVYSQDPGESGSEQVLDMMLQTERGTIRATTLDASAARKKR